jgi:hypothetical protein
LLECTFVSCAYCSNYGLKKKIIEPDEAQALLYRHAEELRAGADQVGLETLTYDVAKQFESLDDDLAELDRP